VAVFPRWQANPVGFVLSVSPARVRTKVRYFPTEEPHYRAHPAGNYVLIAPSREDLARHPIMVHRWQDGIS